MLVAIGSKNPAKVSAVKKIIANEENEVISLNVPSGVALQPFSDEETIRGAINRAESCLENSQAELGIGLEGGVVKTSHGLFLCNWGALASKNEKPIIAGGARILLPTEIEQRLLLGHELGPIMDEYTNQRNIRKREGAIGVFTNEWITRSEMFEHITKMLFGQYYYNQEKIAKA